VVSFGACASSGGPYWDSYAVTKGVDQLVPVDVFVPGCPPPPSALTEALDTLVARVPT
jgi:NADH-quinone oxidoreductase subunit B